MTPVRPTRTLVVCVCLLVVSGGLTPAGQERQSPAAAPKITEAAVQLETKAGKLDGTLDLPPGNGPFPVVVIIVGSGPTDRDGNQPLMKNDSLKLLGQGLAARGIATLRYDKRGLGKSAAAATKEEDLRFDHFAEDVAGWVELLRKDRRFSRVGIVGHSEGSLLGMLAAKRAKADAFVSLAGAGRSAPVVLREQLGTKLSEELKKQSDHILDELVAGRTVADTPKLLAALFRPSVQPYLISWFKYDPAQEIAALEMPVLIVQGTTDVQITVDDAKRLAAAKKDARLVVIDDMNHVLKTAKTPEEQRKAYFEREQPLAAGLVEEVAGFLGKALGVRP